MTRYGSITTYSVVRSASEAFKDQVPYLVALVDEAGSRHAARIEGYRDGETPIRVGMTVRYSHDDTQGNPVYSLEENA